MMRRLIGRRATRRPAALAASLFFLLVAMPSVTVAEDSDEMALRAEYGITLALGGEMEKAENVFLSLLSLSPGDARALNNLGNVYLSRGELATAIAFYEKALESDPEDAAIHLNRAVAHLLGGDQESAMADARIAIEATGGKGEAASLLGLRLSEAVTAEQGKASDTPYLSEQEVLALLEAAAEAVPPDPETVEEETDSTAEEEGAQPDSGEAEDLDVAKRETVKPKTWRSAGPRAVELGEALTILYWKK
jgi:Flp pilus assembly protein TadD